METVNVNDLLLDPLAGCLPIMQQLQNAETMADAIVLRLRLCADKKASASLEKQIKKEAKAGLPKYCEYLVNELQYELRKAMGKNDAEPEILNKWAAYLVKRHKTDDVLDFIYAVKINREKRRIAVLEL